MRNKFVLIARAPDLSVSAKLIWMVLRLHAGGGPADPYLLATQTALCRETVLKGLAELGDSGWYRGRAVDREPRVAKVRIPGDLIMEEHVGLQGRLLYGSLQLLPAFTRPTGSMAGNRQKGEARPHPLFTVQSRR